MTRAACEEVSFDSCCRRRVEETEPGGRDELGVWRCRPQPHQVRLTQGPGHQQEPSPGCGQQALLTSGAGGAAREDSRVAGRFPCYRMGLGHEPREEM